MSGELFFAADEETAPQRRQREAFATAICSTCPVIHQCRTYALFHGEMSGVWGGLTASQLRSGSAIFESESRGANA